MTVSEGMVCETASLREPAKGSDGTAPRRAGPYAWAVFALTFGLLMSDHMARQVLNAVSPLLKADWNLSDVEVASLSSVVAIAVGVLAFPLSVAADRLGRVRSLAAMAILWSLATLGGALASSYPQMLAARTIVGVGEAAYGSVGIAILFAVFPVTMRATLSSAFLAGSVVGQILGMVAGSQIAADHGWRWAFAWIGAAGLLLALAYPVVVREARTAGNPASGWPDWRELAALLFGRRVLWLVYFASGIQLFCSGALVVFMPLLFTRYYGLPIEGAGRLTATLLLTSAAGMLVCGMVADRLARSRRTALPRVAMTCSTGAGVLFALAFFARPGALQVLLLGAGLFLAPAVAGIAGAMVAGLVPSRVHGAAMAVLALGNNLLGLALGPWLVGAISDHSNLLAALLILPVPSALSAGAMALAKANPERGKDQSFPTERRPDSSHAS
ncbi:MAG: MFS transporter [Sphingomonadales bacterium]|nr:MFS transporter [Sphingomonadales bacterium]MDE2569679.1 MFS transporter [Sphingomonadales bacterium]